MSRIPIMHADVEQLLTARTAEDPHYAVEVVDGLLRAAAEAGASDLHFQPTADALKLSWRIDGVLQPVGEIPHEVAANVVTRLKVLARLLTYQSSVPQEGRIAAGRFSDDALPCEVRVSTFPTVFGEKVVARNLPSGREDFARIEDLGLRASAIESLRAALAQTSGAVLIVGPAGSGKTTTAYACLREIVAGSDDYGSTGARNIVTLEDPVEVVVDGVAQAQVNEAAGFDLLTGLRSLVRQDPEVIFIGEIRDPASANVALQAALTGQLVVSTFHASDAAGALSRLADMGVPPYVLRSALNCVVAQRLLRRLCDCAEACEPTEEAALGLTVDSLHRAVGCGACHGTGYSGRVAVSESLAVAQREIAAAILQQSDAKALAAAAAQSGMTRLFDRAVEMVEAGVTSPAEVRRVFGT